MCQANMSRPDIANAVRSVSRRAHDTTRGDRKAVTKSLEHLQRTKDLGLMLSEGGGELVTYADSNYATDRGDWKSASGGTIL